MNIIKLAQEAELLKEDGTEPYRWGVEHLQHFAELVLEAARAYDQTALELCETCGWKAIVPGDGCLVCARQKPVLWYHPLSGRVRFEETSKWIPLYK